MMKTTNSKLPVMSDERIMELKNFKTKDYSDCPEQTPAQLQEFKPKYPDAHLYKPIKQVVQLRLDADILEWLKSEGPGYQTRANAILRQAMLQAD
ncbi:MAG: BrnA antitoxin family protein [Clostridiales bacterium]|nr:BrnA antitoxin family protein [Clostridiales bacterium]